VKENKNEFSSYSEPFIIFIIPWASKTLEVEDELKMQEK